MKRVQQLSGYLLITLILAFVALPGTLELALPGTGAPLSSEDEEPVPKLQAETCEDYVEVPVLYRIQAFRYAIEVALGLSPGIPEENEKCVTSISRIGMMDALNEQQCRIAMKHRTHPPKDDSTPVPTMDDIASANFVSHLDSCGLGMDNRPTKKESSAIPEAAAP